LAFCNYYEKIAIISFTLYLLHVIYMSIISDAEDDFGKYEHRGFIQMSSYGLENEWSVIRNPS